MKDAIGQLEVMMIFSIVLILPLSYLLQAERPQDAETARLYPPAYKVGDVLHSKLGVRLVVDKVRVRGDEGKYWYTCWFIERGAHGYGRRTRDDFKGHEIAGYWEPRNARGTD